MFVEILLIVLLYISNEKRISHRGTLFAKAALYGG